MGGIQGLDTGLGTLLGLLLRGYVTGQQEDMRRRQIEQEAQRLGLPPPPAQPESSYLQRVFNREGVLSPYMRQLEVLKQQEKLAQDVWMEQQKQAAMQKREVHVQQQSKWIDPTLNKLRKAQARQATAEADWYRRITQGGPPSLGGALAQQALPTNVQPAQNFAPPAPSGAFPSTTPPYFPDTQDILAKQAGQRQSKTTQGQSISASGPSWTTSTTQEPTPLAEAAQTTLQAQAKPLEGEQAKRYEALLSIQRGIKQVRALHNSSFTGPIEGSLQGIRRKLPESVQVGDQSYPAGYSQKQIKFYQALNDARAQLLYARSGAQINEAEYQRLLRSLPQETDDDAVFLAGLDRFEDELNAAIKATAEVSQTPRGALLQRQPLTLEEQLDQEF